MSPHFPPLSLPHPQDRSPLDARPRAAQARSVRSGAPLSAACEPAPPHVERPRVGDPFLLARVMVTLAGVSGFLGLLIAAAYVRSAQEELRVSALLWFLGFGVAKMILDVRALAATRRDGLTADRSKGRR